MMQNKRNQWMERGVEIAPEVDLARIADDAVICRGCRIGGAQTSIAPGCVIGSEGPAVLSDCQLGYGVELGGGFFDGATFLSGVRFGNGTHVRPGTLVEEAVVAGNGVGLKNTMLMPYTMLGSQVNFCDILMAGGTASRPGEVGSFYVHFNYTPHGDKATGSLIGDVPRGVFLDQPPTFLGGQGGLVGPVRIAFGVVVAAGFICRDDILKEGGLYVPAPLVSGHWKRQPRSSIRLEGTLKNNLHYIGNLRALREWYRDVRAPLMNHDPFLAACHAGALRNLDRMLDAAIASLAELVQTVAADVPQVQQQPAEIWAEMRGSGDQVGAAERDVVTAALENGAVDGTVLETVNAFVPAVKAAGQAWLQAVVDSTMALWRKA